MSPIAARTTRPATAVQPADGRRQNLALVLQTLRHHGPLSRAQLAREVGVTKVTMSALVSELADRGQVRDVGPANSTGPGKPGTLVDLDPDGLLAVAVDLSDPRQLVAAVIDSTGAVRHREVTDAEPNAANPRVDPEVVVSLVRRAVSAMPSVLGIGIGTPGLVDAAGTVVTAANLGWQDVPLRDLVRDATQLPVVVTNDSEAATRAEWSASPLSSDMVLVQLGAGVGCGLVSGGRLITGAHHAAGEIGHITVGTDGGGLCSCGRHGCLETWISVPLLQRAAAAGDRDMPITGAQRLAVALTPLVAALDLSEVVVAGPVNLTAPLIDTLSAALAERLLPNQARGLTVRLASEPADIVLHGAAALVLWDRLGIV